MKPTRRHNGLGHAALVAALLTTSTVDAQTTRVIPSTIACRTCAIDARRVASLGSDSDPVSPGNFEIGVSRDSRGRYYVAPMADLSVIALFDSSGRFLTQIGRKGRGPGEYEFVMRAHVGPNDSLYVIDDGNRRFTVLAPDHGVARSVPVRGTLTHGFPLSDGRFVAAGRFTTPERLGLPIHVLDSTGVVHSFGATDRTARRDQYQAQVRQIAPARAGGVWSGRLDRYEVERWTLEGERISHLTRQAEWFPAWTDYQIQPPDMARPKPMLLALWDDAHGRLWTVSKVARENWRATRAESEGAHMVPPLDVFERTTETIIEVIDVERGALLASTRVPAYIRGVVSPGVLYALRSTPEGDIRVDIWNVALRGAR